MIPYIEVLTWNNGKTALYPSAIVEPSECWFELSYYEAGECEIYAPATVENLATLQKGNFVKIPHKDFIWVILSVQYTFNADGARMISAKGFEAKWIVSKRIISDPIALPSSLAEALQTIFSANLGTGAIQQRRIDGLSWLLNGLNGKTTEAQATRGNLWDFVKNLLKLHKVGTVSTLTANGKIIFETVNGQDKSATVKFSQSLDNLISSTFYSSDENLKTNCQIVSSFSEQETSGGETINVNHEYVSYYPSESEGGTGIDRSEIMVEPNLSTKVKNSEGTEREIDPNSQEFKQMQKAEGAAALADHQTVIEFDGQIDLEHSGYVFGVDFFIGDQVEIRDEYFGILATARVTKYTFKQDAGGYGEEAEYGTD